MAYYPPQPYIVPQEPPLRKQRDVPKGVLLCIFILLVAYGTGHLIYYIYELTSAQQTSRELRQIAWEPADAEIPDGPAAAEPSPGQAAAKEHAAPPAAEARSSVPAEPPESARAGDLKTAPPAQDEGRLPEKQYPNGLTLVPKIQKLQKKNQYVVGWIKADDLDEPIVQKDNTFFLDHDASGKRNSNGAIFMDQWTSLLTRPYTILLYGHNMRSGAMFGRLKKYKETSYYYRHLVIQCDTLYEEGQYAVFAVETISLTPGLSKYLSLTDLRSADRETRRTALDTLIRNNMHSSMLDVNVEDQLLLLITCVGDDDERLVVAARRLREGEKANSLIMMNTKR